MPQFEYKAFDASGQDHAGTIDAAHANEAVRNLAAQGLRVQKVTLTQAASSAYAPATPSYASPMAAPVVINRPQARQALQPAPVQIVRTKPATDSDLFLVFTQLANLLQSGISPSEAFNTLSTRGFHSQFADAFLKIASLTANGVSMADAMAHAPDIFPEGAIGAVRAGETGGYLWQACAEVARQQQVASSLRKFYYWSQAMFWVNVCTFPLIFVGTRGIDAAASTLNHPEQNALSEMMRGMGSSILGPMGLLCLLLGGACLYGRKWGSQTSQRRLRHGMALQVPVLSKRNRSEGLQVFSYHMSMLGRAGISPHRSWKLAAAAVPNMVQAEELGSAGSQMNESTPASRALYQSPHFPQELAALVETGEMTGTISNALDQAAEVNRQQIQTYDAIFKVNAVIWIALINFAFMALGYAFILRGYMDALFKHALSTD